MEIARQGQRAVLPLGVIANGYNLYRQAQPYLNTARNIVRGIKRSYNEAFGENTNGTRKMARTTRRTYGRRRPYTRRKPRFSRRKRTTYKRRGRYGNRKRRNLGSRQPRASYITLQKVKPFEHVFEQNSSGLYNPVKVEMDSAGAWFPDYSEVNLLAKDRFDSAESKRLVSIHIYIKSMGMTYWLTDTGKTKMQPTVIQDAKFMTYSNKYDYNNPSALPYAWMQTNGVSSKVTRNRLKYHKVSKDYISCRSNIDYTLDALASKTSKAIDDELDMYNYTGGQIGTHPRINTDWWACPEIMMPESRLLPTAPKCICAVEGEYVITTKWRLYGSKI